MQEVKPCPKCGKPMHEEIKFFGLWSCPDSKIILTDKPPYLRKCDGMELTEEGSQAFEDELKKLASTARLGALCDTWYERVEILRELGDENILARDNLMTCISEVRDMQRVIESLLTESLELTRYAASAFVYDEDGDGTPEWFEGLREQLEILQPKLINAVEPNVAHKMMNKPQNDPAVGCPLERWVMPLALAKRFHDTYERLAPSFGYETRTETREFDPDSPNGRLMIAVCAEVMGHNLNSTTPPDA